MLKRLGILNVSLLVLALVISLVPVSVGFAQDDGGETDPDEMELLVEIEGPITITEDGIFVAGYEIAPAGSFNPSDFEDGDYVIVTGFLLNDDTFKATDIELVEDPADSADNDPDDADDDTADADDSTDAGSCQHEDHPVLLAYADEFSVDVAVLAESFCDGNGLGEIGRALLLANSADIDAGWEEILAMREEMGWGAIFKEFGVKPNQLTAPGQAIGRDRDDGDAPGNSGNAPGQSGDAPGNSGNAPGQSGDHGNSGNNGNNGNNGGKKK